MSTLAMVQVFTVNGLVSRNEKVGISLPASLAGWLRKQHEAFPYRDRWVVGAAALVALMRLPATVREKLLAEVSASRSYGNKPEMLLKPQPAWLDVAMVEAQAESGDVAARVVLPLGVYTALQAKAEAKGKTLEQYLADLAGNPRRLPRIKPDHLAADTRGNKVKFLG